MPQKQLISPSLVLWQAVRFSCSLAYAFNFPTYLLGDLQVTRPQLFPNGKPRDWAGQWGAWGTPSLTLLGRFWVQKVFQTMHLFSGIMPAAQSLCALYYHTVPGTMNKGDTPSVSYSEADWVFSNKCYIWQMPVCYYFTYIVHACRCVSNTIHIVCCRLPKALIILHYKMYSAR